MGFCIFGHVSTCISEKRTFSLESNKIASIVLEQCLSTDISTERSQPDILTSHSSSSVSFLVKTAYPFAVFTCLKTEGGWCGTPFCKRLCCQRASLCAREVAFPSVGRHGTSADTGGRNHAAEVHFSVRKCIVCIVAPNALCCIDICEAERTRIPSFSKISAHQCSKLLRAPRFLPEGSTSRAHSSP